MKLFIITTLVGMGICFPLGNWQENSAEEMENQELNQGLRKQVNWFNSFGPHVVPIFDCQEKLEGKIFRLPDIPECEKIRRIDKDLPYKVTAVNLTVWDWNTNLVTIEGFHCFASKFTRVNVHDWWHYTHEIYEEQINLTEEECEDMIYRFKTPRNDNMEFQGHGSYKFVESVKHYWKWGSRLSFEYNGYYVDKYGIAVDPFTRKIQTVAPTVQQCTVDEGSCETTQGFIKWRPTDFNNCTLVQKYAETWLKHEFNHGEIEFSCQNRNSIITEVKYLPVCAGVVLGVSGENVMFTYDNLNLTTTTADAAIQIKKRSKRTILVSHSFINAQLTHVQNSSRENFYQGKRDLCMHQREVIRSGRVEALRGDPNPLIQSSLGRGYKGVMLGMNMLVWKCRKVNNYRLISQERQCTEEWPIEYYDSNRILRKAYLDRSLTIVENPTSIECLNNWFYISYGKYSYLLNNPKQNEALEFPSLPLHGSHKSEFVQSKFTQVGDISAADISSRDSLGRLFQDVQKSKNLFKAMSGNHGNADPDKMVTDIREGIMEWAWGKYGSIIENWVIGIVLSLVLLLILFLVFCLCQCSQCCMNCVNCGGNHGRLINFRAREPAREPALPARREVRDPNPVPDASGSEDIIEEDEFERNLNDLNRDLRLRLGMRPSAPTLSSLYAEVN